MIINLCMHTLYVANWDESEDSWKVENTNRIKVLVTTRQKIMKTEIFWKIN